MGSGPLPSPFAKVPPFSPPLRLCRDRQTRHTDVTRHSALDVKTPRPCHSALDVKTLRHSVLDVKTLRHSELDVKTLRHSGLDVKTPRPRHSGLDPESSRRFLQITVLLFLLNTLFSCSSDQKTSLRLTVKFADEIKPTQLYVNAKITDTEKNNKRHQRPGA